jgi:hypothetical protein
MSFLKKLTVGDFTVQHMRSVNRDLSGRKYLYVIRDEERYNQMSLLLTGSPLQRDHHFGRFTGDSKVLL